MLFTQTLLRNFYSREDNGTMMHKKNLDDGKIALDTDDDGSCKFIPKWIFIFASGYTACEYGSVGVASNKKETE